MRVCHFISTSLSGAYFENLFAGLLKNSIEIICVELGDYNPPQWLTKFPQIKYFNLGIYNKKKYPLAVWRLARILRREKIDILQTHLYNAGFIGVLAARLSLIPTVLVTRHHTSIVKLLGKNYHIMIDRLMADTADGVVAVSDAVRQFMKENDGVKKDHIEVIHIGFDFERLKADDTERKEIRREFGLTDDNFVIGYVAQFIPGKGHPQLINAFRQIIERIPQSRLLLIGSGDREIIDSVINTPKLKDNIIFAGWRNDVPACIRAMDVFVQPSLSEAFSQVIIETMSIGTPLIATDVGGAREVITHGENALIVQPDKPSEITEAVIHLYKNKEFRKNLADNAQKHVRKTFTINRMVDKQIAVYRKYFKNVGKD